jgi:hypothetical protein
MFRAIVTKLPLLETAGAFIAAMSLRVVLMLVVLGAVLGCANMTVVRVPVTCTAANPTPVHEGTERSHERRGVLRRVRDALRPSAKPDRPRR